MSNTLTHCWDYAATGRKRHIFRVEGATAGSHYAVCDSMIRRSPTVRRITKPLPCEYCQAFERAIK